MAARNSTGATTGAPPAPIPTARSSSSNTQPSFREDEQISIDRYGASVIRDALLIGLASYGEIERLKNEVDVMKLCGTPAPEGLIPIDPTADPTTVSRFAEALRFLSCAEDRANDNADSMEAANG